MPIREYKVGTHDKSNIIEYATSNAKPFVIGGFAVGTLVAFNDWEELLPEKRPQGLLRGLAWTARRSGYITLVLGGAGFAFHAIEAAVEKAQGKHTMSSGLVAGAAAGALLGSAAVPAFGAGSVAGYAVLGSIITWLTDVTGELYPKMWAAEKPYGRSTTQKWGVRDAEVATDPASVVAAGARLAMYRDDSKKAAALAKMAQGDS